MAGARRAAVWVIDGASQLGDHALVEGRSPAAWLAATASAYLARMPWAESGRPIRDVVRELILYVREAGRRAGLADAAGFPSATLSLVRLVHDHLELCLLGDSPVLVRPPGSPAAAFVDPQFDGAEERLLDAVRAELDRGVAPATVYARAQATNRERRIQRNTPAGLWVLADIPEAAEHAFVTTVPITSGMELVVMSDGFARALHPFGLVTSTDALLDEIAAGRAEALLDRLRTAERADSARVAFPRFSISDDATMLHARLSRTD
ncbi:protein phosphatase 2C domain-containing protein [Frankia sp. AgPm24]|uniref:protein phosphatase 2C domain-containing protein n=1 Tax=Frankia sp. AgPm24 TaxID=631128 RepID=UPI00200CB811|nr:protein phosphatase 2C domain-containing protein [Frankia sp. AgPm24]MCK9924146.1 protein phosphatase 2C domain-containing protein [Frankia sp. AgPm24]